MIAAMSSTPSFFAVAERQYFAMLVDPVFNPVTSKFVDIFKSLFVLERPNSFDPCLVTWVMFSIQIVV